MINWEQLIEIARNGDNNHWADQDFTDEGVIRACKEALKLAIPLILTEVAEKVELIDIQEELGDGFYSVVNKQGILDLQKELEEKLLK